VIMVDVKTHDVIALVDGAHTIVVLHHSPARTIMSAFMEIVQWDIVNVREDGEIMTAAYQWCTCVPIVTSAITAIVMILDSVFVIFHGLVITVNVIFPDHSLDVMTECMIFQIPFSMNHQKNNT